jgi:arginyl-tRNA synthetase
VKSVMLACAMNYSPSSLCTYLFELGQSFNKFYQNVKVLDSEEERQLLLAIVEATAEIMREGLYLLGIETVSRM